MPSVGMMTLTKPGIWRMHQIGTFWRVNAQPNRAIHEDGGNRAKINHVSDSTDTYLYPFIGFKYTRCGCLGANLAIRDLA
jgi:hypothetical protein